jgi:hypothetical protein
MSEAPSTSGAAAFAAPIETPMPATPSSVKKIPATKGKKKPKK